MTAPSFSLAGDDRRLKHLGAECDAYLHGRAALEHVDKEGRRTLSAAPSRFRPSARPGSCLPPATVVSTLTAAVRFTVAPRRPSRRAEGSRDQRLRSKRAAVSAAACGGGGDGDGGGVSFRAPQRPGEERSQAGEGYTHLGLRTSRVDFRGSRGRALKLGPWRQGCAKLVHAARLYSWMRPPGQQKAANARNRG